MQGQSGGGEGREGEWRCSSAPPPQHSSLISWQALWSARTAEQAHTGAQHTHTEPNPGGAQVLRGE